MDGHFGRIKGKPVSVEEALTRVLDRVGTPRILEVSLAEAAGHVLASEAKSDIDMPPFDRCAMDGYAVRSEDSRGAPCVLDATGEAAAGSIALGRVGAGQAFKVMTGAALPAGADAVQMVERTRLKADGRVELLEPVRQGENVSPRGEDLKAGDRILSLGTYLGPPEIGLLAAVGVTRPKIFAPPRVAILSTGDELVAPEERPGPGQIRGSNGSALAALAAQERCPVVDLGIARDDPAALRERLAHGLKSDILLVTGGVSMGEKDLVDRTLRDLGVELWVESVAVKPGKPLVFGTRGATLAFGLPGNPLSCLVGFFLFVAPAIRKLRCLPKILPQRVKALVLGAVKGDRHRRCYVRSTLRLEEGRFVCEPVATHGSADLPAYTRGNTLIEVPEGRTRVESGETAWVLFDDTFLRR